MRILLVEDNAMLGDAVKTGLAQAGYTVEWLKDGESGLIACEDDTFSTIILDINLPHFSGLEILKKMRKSHNHTPVLLLTAQDGLNQKVEGLDAGADDYVVKPFDMDELSARVRALVRRKHGRSSAVLVYNDIELDPAARTVKLSGEIIPMTAQELKVLTLFMESVGKVKSKSQIEEAMYGWETEINSNTIEAVIYKLRKKLGQDLITTIRGIGYIIPSCNSPL